MPNKIKAQKKDYKKIEIMIKKAKKEAINFVNKNISHDIYLRRAATL